MLKLAHHAYAAEIAGALVFLDLKRDTYTFIAPKHAAEILCLLGDAVGSCLEPIGNGEPSGDESSTLGELRRAGLVTADPSGKAFQPILYDSVVEELPRLIGPDRPSIRLSHALHFLWAVLSARCMLSLLPLDRVVRAIQRRRLRQAHADDVVAATRLTEIYRRLRPMLFSRGDRCLLDSLSLINFLGRYGIRAGWRFGVRLEPFKAHAWVQDGNTVFDDMAANIHSYTAILEA